MLIKLITDIVNKKLDDIKAFKKRHDAEMSRIQTRYENEIEAIDFEYSKDNKFKSEYFVKHFRIWAETKKYDSKLIDLACEHFSQNIYNDNYDMTDKMIDDATVAEKGTDTYRANYKKALMNFTAEMFESDGELDRFGIPVSVNWYYPSEEFIKNEDAIKQMCIDFLTFNDEDRNETELTIGINKMMYTFQLYGEYYGDMIKPLNEKLKSMFNISSDSHKQLPKKIPKQTRQVKPDTRKRYMMIYLEVWDIIHKSKYEGQQQINTGEAINRVAKARGNAPSAIENAYYFIQKLSIEEQKALKSKL